MTTHAIQSQLLERPVKVDLVGCGGNGSQVLTGLARLDRALRACGHPGGLQVRAWDPDLVSEANIGRQLFYPADQGRNKAEVLVHRLNLCYGLAWAPAPEWYRGEAHRSYEVAPNCYQQGGRAADVLITCVDSAKARREIARAICDHTHGSLSTPLYWLDLGNRQTDGQVILGQPVDAVNAGVGSARDFREGGAEQARRKAAPLPRLPTVVEIFPELLDESIPEDNAPSCSLAEALESQDLFVNDHVSRWALHLLWTLFRRGKIEHHGYFVNLASGQVNPLPVPGGKAARRERRVA